VSSRDVTCKKISHCVSGDSTRCLRRAPFSLTDSSFGIDPRDCQRWVISRWTLRGELRRKGTTAWDYLLTSDDVSLPIVP
jgi:hypothetical protein